MIKFILPALLAAPALLFSQEAPAVSYTLKPSGIAFMAAAWICIITWNIICFSKILRNKK